MWVEWHHVCSRWGIYSLGEDIQTPTIGLCASVRELLIEHCPRGAGGASEAVRDMNSWQGTGRRRWKGQKSLCVKEQERVADIQVYLSVSPGLWEWVTKGAGQPGLSELFCLSSTMGSCLIQIRCLSVTFTHWYFVTFVCAASTDSCTFTWISVCEFLSSDCDLQSGRIVPSFMAIPPSCHLPLHTANIFREWQIEIWVQARLSATQHPLNACSQMLPFLKGLCL